MTRRAKVLMLSMTALLAMSAFAAAAQATTPATFTSTNQETTVSATPDGAVGSSTAHHVFDAAGLSITCNQIRFHQVQGGVASGGLGFAFETLTVEPTYDECTFLGVSVTVNMNGCQFVFSAANGVVIQNRIGKSCALEPITFEGPGAKVEVGPQSLTGITYHNVKPGTSEEITVEALVKNIAGKCTGIFCGSSSFANGEYTTGNTLVTCAPKNNTVSTIPCKWDAKVP